MFKLNVELFPESWNVYDSLGEALLKAGDTEKAIKMYEKSLTLNPESKSGKDALAKLKSRNGHEVAGGRDTPDDEDRGAVRGSWSGCRVHHAWHCKRSSDRVRCGGPGFVRRPVLLTRVAPSPT